MDNYLGLNTWFTQKAMARILGTSQQNISAHIRKILSINPTYERIFIRKSRGRAQTNSEKKNGSGRNYYHEIILELITSRIHTKESADFLLSVERTLNSNQKKYNLQMRKIQQ